MTVAASCREVLVSQFAEGNDLNDRFGVSPWLNRELVAARFTEDYHVSLALSTDHKLSLFARDLHRVKRFMRFNCVGDALGEFVPDLEGVVEARRDELLVVHPHDARHLVLMRSRRLKVTLANDNILIDVSLHLLLRLRISLDFFVVSGRI